MNKVKTPKELEIETIVNFYNEMNRCNTGVYLFLVGQYSLKTDLLFNTIQFSIEAGSEREALFQLINTVKEFNAISKEFVREII